MKIIIPNVEVRGIEKKFSDKRQSEYLVINYDTEEGLRESIVDRNMTREPLYKRGLVGDIKAELKIGHKKDGSSYVDMTVVDFTT